MIVRRTNTINRRSRSERYKKSEHLLEVRMRRNSHQDRQIKKILSFFAKTTFVFLFLGMTYFGGQMLLEKFLFKNPDYNVKHLEASLDGVLTLPEVKKLTGLQEGINIFQLNLSAAEKLLSDLPSVKKAHVERILPNTIQVSLERRTPILRLASSPQEEFMPGQSLLIDAEGVVMSPEKLEPSFLELPLLIGVSSSGVALGKPLQEEHLSFILALWSALNNPNCASLITPHLFDVSRSYCAVVTDASNAHFIFGEENLPGQCDRLQKLFAHAQTTGRQIESANLMLEHNTPVTFRLNSEVASLAAQSKSSHLH